MITTEESVLWALVFKAFAKRENGDQPAFGHAVVEIVDTWYRWPLICHQQAIIEARLDQEQRDAEYVTYLGDLANWLDAKCLGGTGIVTDPTHARPAALVAPRRLAREDAACARGTA